ncbi:MAG: hypothetical protein ABWX92_18025 [Mycetocola sp.]
MPALFLAGSFLFAVGSFPPYAQLVDARLVGVTFFVGSLFFTAAAYSQFVQTIRTGSHIRVHGWLRWVAWQPRRLLWWAAVVQLAGTLLFNRSTADALMQNLSVEQVNRLVWAPDLFGSIAFLIASHLAWLTVRGRPWGVLRNDSDWWGAMVNYAGSVFFMFSAIASVTLPTTGEVLNLTLVNAGTFLGAVCFFGGACLLLPSAPSRTGRVVA